VIGNGHCSKAGYPASALSNFTPHPFELDGVSCASMEGFLQSLKFSNPDVQREVCKLTGLATKFRGKKRNKAWKRIQTLWWQGKAFDRHGKNIKIFSTVLLKRSQRTNHFNERFWLRATLLSATPSGTETRLKPC